MEGKDQERLVIAKPVASRPSCPNFMSFSELLSGAIDASPPSSFAEKTVPIKPKTVRLKSSAHLGSVPSVSSQFQGEVSGAQVIKSADKVLKPECRSTVVYKPLAKLVSRAAVSHLANLGNFEIGHQQPITPVQSQAFGQTQAQSSEHSKHHYQTQPISPNLHHKSSLQPLANPAIESPKLASQNPEQNQRAPMPIAVGDRPSYDGYNWRKYGQKQVKGSEYPRSYYKCTHPNCPVKKKVERSLDGQIAEIVYKGEHNHKKPQPPKRLASGSQGQAFVSEGASRESIQPLWNNLTENEGSEGKMENHLPGNPTYQGKGVLNRDPMAVAFNSGIGSPENSCGLSGDFDEGSKREDGDDEEPNHKRRKIEDKGKGGGSLEQEVREPLIVVQSNTESEIVGDGFRWRKYGQKVVKGNPYPRSYYRCTSLKCNVRKHVERVSDDPKAFITTYEGKHNHDMPITRSVNPVALDQDLQPPDKAKQG